MKERVVNAELEKLACATLLTSAKEAHAKEVANLKSRWDAHVFQHSWLFAKVEAQGQNIGSHVEVEKVYFCYQELKTPMLKSVFGLDFRNKSFFDISIEKKLSGYIEFNGTPLEATPLIFDDPTTIGVGGKGTITIEQRLTRPEADLIASTDPKLAEFNLTNLLITIKGERLTPTKPQYLTIPKRLYSDPQSDLRERLAELSTELERHKKPQVSFTLERGTHEFYIIVTSSIRIDDLRVEIEQMTIGGRDYFNVPLRLKDNTQPYRRVFTIEPGHPKSFHIASIETGKPPMLHTATPETVPEGIPDNQPFHIVVRGSNTLPLKKSMVAIQRGGAGSSYHVRLED